MKSLTNCEYRTILWFTMAGREGGRHPDVLSLGPARPDLVPGIASRQDSRIK